VYYLVFVFFSIFSLFSASAYGAPQEDLNSSASNSSAPTLATNELPAQRAPIETKKLSRITVTGGLIAVEEVPGAADVIAGEKLVEAEGGLDDINRVLRRVPGVNIQEEDGYGLRPNIGLRGAASERSENITLMEDGVLSAPAPYSAPAAYYFPPIGRMEGIEVLKGASQIKYGPRTTGGSINMLSSSIPSELSGEFSGKAGVDDTLIGHLKAGGAQKHLGWLVETYQSKSDGFKQLDGGGDTGFDLQDYLGKFRINTDAQSDFYQELEIKLGAYDLDDNETYLGLSAEDFGADPFRRYRGSQNDNIKVDHDQLTLRHYGELSESLDITTIFYTNKTKRNWYKLESVNGTSISDILEDTSDFSDEFGWIRGDGNSPNDALALRNNRRKYAARGVQSALGYDVATGDVEHSFEFGARYHYDYEDRFQEEDRYRMDNGTLVLTTPGKPGSQANRKSEADAIAFYLQDRASIGRWTLTPGLRYEKVNLQYSDFGKTNPDRLEALTKRNYSGVDVWIPGIGAHYALSDSLGVFTGIHKGFAPPGPSPSDDVDPEESINYELGIRYDNDAISSELTFFYNDYSNLLGADTAASGGQGSGDLFNAGAATVYGLEAMMEYDLASGRDLPVSIPVFANYTFTQAEFDDTFDSTLFGEVISGDPIPYIAEHQGALGVGVGYQDLSVNLGMHAVDSMPTAAAAEGRRGGPRTDSYAVFDLRSEYRLTEQAKIFAVVENIFDREYAVALRPAGARPGRPQTFMAGLTVRF
jgi:Fe(3+) dicitrate transport protein